MIKILSILLFVPLFANSQVIADTTYFGTAPNWVRVVSYRNSLTTSFLPKSDSISGVFATAYRLKIKTDSLAAALAVSTAASLALKQNTLVSGTNIKTVNGGTLLGSGDIAISGTAAWGSVTGTLSNQTDLQNALNAKQNTITVLPFANGGVSGSAAAPATTGAMTVNMTSSVITITPTGACTLNASGGVAGQIVTIAVTTSGTTSFVITFGTNFRKVGTLATGTTSARFFSVTFICVTGTIWQEIGRTAAQT